MDDIISYIKNKLDDKVSNEDLELFHSIAHVNNKIVGDEWCKLHYDIVLKMISRGLSHRYTKDCDRPINDYVENNKTAIFNSINPI